MTTDAHTDEGLEDVVRAAWEDGCPVASKPEKIAPIARRRWHSFASRNIDADDFESRIEDLAKGLIAACEANPRLVGPLTADYLWLSRQLAAVLGKTTGESK